jgi:hypothetical protein
MGSPLQNLPRIWTATGPHRSGEGIGRIVNLLQDTLAGTVVEARHNGNSLAARGVDSVNFGSPMLSWFIGSTNAWSTA